MAFHNFESDPAAFPRLNQAQWQRIRELATRRDYADGQALFEQGDLGFGLFVIEEGHVRTVQRTAGGDVEVAEHFPNEFTGDLSILNRQVALSAAVADGGVIAWQLSSEDLQRLVSQDAELAELVLGTFMLRRDLFETPEHATVTVIGSRWSPRTFELKDFLARNRVTFRSMDPDAVADVEGALCSLRYGPRDLPLVITHNAGVMKNPSTLDVANALGLRSDVDQQTYDLVIIGAGPGGLAAAVYAASEGLSTLVVDSTSPGGQAGHSSRIENFLGFPLGLSGAELAERAVTQAQRFGATISSPARVIAIDAEGPYKTLRLESGEVMSARAVLVATGASYRRLAADGCVNFEGRGVFYAATAMEAGMCRGGDIVVVGGGNSAGQAAVFLSKCASSVRLVVRSESLAKSMSRYLIDRIENTENIQLLTQTQVSCVSGNGTVESVRINQVDGESEDVKTAGVFVMVGADPCTSWLRGVVGLDAKGFVATGRDARKHPDFAQQWHEGREPHDLETTRPGVFAVGDVRSGSVKRVASAVGEGSMAVRYVHEVLGE